MDLSIKTSIGIATILFMSSQALATEVFYGPGNCAPENLTLKIKNRSSGPERLWTQVRLGDEIDEIQYDLDAKSEMKIKGTEFLPTTSSYSLKTWENNRIQVTASCLGSEIPLATTTSPEVTHFFPTNTRTVKLNLVNLFLKSNHLQLKAYSRFGVLVAEKDLTIEKYYDTASVKWNFSESVSRIEIKAENRMHSVATYEVSGKDSLSPSMATTPALLKPDAQKVYFLVSTKDSRPDEAFVVGMDEPVKIATAREQIKNPALEKIMVGGIELGNGETNRAFLAKDKAPYSWHVTRIDAFADFAHIDCDGSPDLTEERLNQKLNEGGRICFWRYRIVRELSLEEVATGKLKP